MQLCGWIGAYDLFPGAISDTEYFNEASIFEVQRLFQEWDGGDKFLNVVDRGYCVTKAAWLQNQLILQPVFAKSDMKFSTQDTLKSSSVAADRSGNERSVCICKQANVFKNYSTNMTCTKDIERMSDLWLTQSFQVNFMYKNVK